MSLSNEALDRYAFRSWAICTGEINHQNREAMREAYNEIRPRFGEDSIGFRTFLIIAGHTGANDLKKAADIYFEIDAE
jgi:hypothetical protein